MDICSQPCIIDIQNRLEDIRAMLSAPVLTSLQSIDCSGGVTGTIPIVGSGIETFPAMIEALNDLNNNRTLSLCDSTGCETETIQVRVFTGCDDEHQPLSENRNVEVIKGTGGQVIELFDRLFNLEAEKCTPELPPTVVYGIPVNAYQEKFTFKPQVQLFFRESTEDVEEGYSPVVGQFSFRLMQSPDSITMEQATSLGLSIKSLFGGDNPFVWRKGKLKISYYEHAKGYFLQLMCRDRAEGKRLITSTLAIQGYSPDWKYMRINESESPATAYPTNPGTHTILGQSANVPRKRPIADVIFHHAVLHIWGRGEPVVLYDRSMTYKNPLVV